LLIAALLLPREKPAGLRVTRPLLGQVVHPLSELLRVALVLSALVPAAPGPLEALLLAERLLLPWGLTLLALELVLDGLLPSLLALRLLGLWLLHLLALRLLALLRLLGLGLLRLWLSHLLALGLLRLWLSHLLALGLLRPWLLGLRLLHLLVLRLLGLLALLLWLLHLLALELLRLLVWLLALGLLRLLLWLLGLLSAGELATLPACGRLFLVFGRPTRRTRGALLLAGLLLTAPSCLSFLSLLTELVLVALITHSLSPVAVCRFATDGSNEGLDIGKPDSGTPGGRPPSRDRSVDPSGRNAGSR
jgi:hypothetical protein